MRTGNLQIIGRLAVGVAVPSASQPTEVAPAPSWPREGDTDGPQRARPATEAFSGDSLALLPTSNWDRAILRVIGPSGFAR